MASGDIGDGDGDSGGGGGSRFVFAYYTGGGGGGSGRATRALQVVTHLVDTGSHVHLVTAAPDFVFIPMIDHPGLHLREVEQIVLDCVYLEPDALTVSSAAKGAVPQSSILKREAEWLKSVRADMVMLDPWTTDDAAHMDIGTRNSNWESPQRVWDKGETSYASNLETPMRNALLHWEGARGREETPSPRPRSKRSRGSSLSPSPTLLKGGHQQRSSSSPPSLRAVETRTKVRPLHIGIYWDADNCRVPSGLATKISVNIKNALSSIPDIDSATAVIRSYGRIAESTVQGLQSTGVIHSGTDNRKKNCADKLMWSDLFQFTCDHPAPSYILLITGDSDFAPFVRILERRGHTVLIALPTEAITASSLFGAGRCMYDWPSLARGDGFVIRLPVHADLEALKAEMIQLYQLKHVDMGQIPAAYTKMFRKQLRLADYGVTKMIELFGQMGPPFSIVNQKVVFSSPSASFTPQIQFPAAVEGDPNASKETVLFTAPITGVTPHIHLPTSVMEVMEDSSVALEGYPNAWKESAVFDDMARDAAPHRTRWDETPPPVLADADATPATTPSGVTEDMGSATPGGLDASAPAGDNSSESGDYQS